MKKHFSGESDGEKPTVWGVPEAGMFYWSVDLVSRVLQSLIGVHRFKLLLFPDESDTTTIGDSEALIRSNALEAGVLALPGTSFLPNGGSTAYVRAAFSLLGEDEIDEALRRLREVVKEARTTAG
jgi:tryptophan aminotransferase